MIFLNKFNKVKMGRIFRQITKISGNWTFDVFFYYYA